MKTGATGYRVKVVQYQLRHRGYGITVDGSFGSQTASVVKSFQSSQGLVADGLVGPKTWPRLVVSVRLGSSGDGVRAAQAALTANGYTLTVDGSFGSVTDGKLKAFQKAHGLTADGIWGPKSDAAAFPPAKPAPTGSALIRAVQAKLKSNYPLYAGNLVVDGIQGPKTTAAIKEFQRRSGLTADGIVGPRTRKALGV